MPDLVTVPCGGCGATVAHDPRFTPWCEACDWNLNPGAAPEPRGAWARWRSRRSDRLARQVHDEIMREGATPQALRRGTGLHRVAVLVSLPVHALTVLLAAGAVAVGVAPVPLLVRVPGALLLGGITLAVFPHPARSPRGPGVLTARTAPASFTVLAQVARAAGARVPDLLVVDLGDNASVGQVGWHRRRVLTLGMALWHGLDAGEQLAVLGHELGHDVNDDVRRMLPVWTALDSMVRWARLLHPQGTAGRPPRDSLVVIAETLLVPLQHAIFWAVVGLSSRLYALSARAGQTAEYRADLVAADVAGRDTAAAAISRLLLQAHRHQTLITATNRRDPDIWATLRSRAGEIPDTELRRVERAARQGLHRVDDTHPPTPFRLDVLRAQPDRPAAVRLDPDQLAAMDAELMSVVRKDRVEFTLG